MSLTRMATHHSIGLPSIIHRSPCCIFLLGSEKKKYRRETNKERQHFTLLSSVLRILTVAELSVFWFRKVLRSIQKIKRIGQRLIL